MRNNVSLVYFARCLDGTVKIGSTIHPQGRWVQLGKLRPEFLFGFYVHGGCSVGLAVERVFHRHFDTLRVGISEQFELDSGALTEARALSIWHVDGSGPFCECHGLTRHRQVYGWKTAPRRPVLLMRVTPKPEALRWIRRNPEYTVTVQ